MSAPATPASAPAAASARPPSLTSVLVRLQLRLFWRLTKSSTAQLVGSIVMALMVLGSVIPGLWGLVAMRGASVEFRGVLLTLGFALLTLMWPIAVTLMTGNNDMLDAGRFSLYPVRMLQMLPGLVISAAMGLGGVMTLLLGIGYVAAWSTSPATLIAAIVGGVLGFVTCLVSSRALSSVLAGVLRRRKARDLVMVGMVLLILLLSFGLQIGSRLFAQDAVNGGATISVPQLVASVQAVARVAAWTPFGWAWGLPWAVAQGAWGTAVVWLVLALLWAAGLSWVWAHMFGQSLISPLESAGGAQKIVKANPLDRFIPDSPAGAVAKRELRYWRRDPRRLVGALSMFLMPFLMLVPMMLSVNSDPTMPADLGPMVAAYCPAMLAWMAAVFVSMDISYDGSALATQIVAGVRGRDDRWGRALAFMMIFGTVQLVYIIGFVAYSGHWELLPAVLGISAGLLLVGTGIGSWSGSMWQVAQPPAGSSLMGRNGAGGVAGFLSAMVGMLLPLVIVAPAIVLGILAAVLGPVYGWIALAVGVAEGWFFLWWGVRSGGRRLDRSWPEVLVKVTWKG